MASKRQIFCIEGVHQNKNEEEDLTIKPMLELLVSTTYWKGYQRHRCETKERLKSLLEGGWRKCGKGSVLYFYTHGDFDEVTLNDCHDETKIESVHLDEFQKWIGKCRGRHIHFGGCCTFSGDKSNLKKITKHTKAASVSGYAGKVGWLEWTSPGVALDLQLLALLSHWDKSYIVDLAKNTLGREIMLKKIRKRIKQLYPKKKYEFRFQMLVRPYDTD